MHLAVLLLAGLVAALLLMSWLRRSPPRIQRPHLGVVLALIGAALLIALSARLHWGMTAVGLALPLIYRLWQSVRASRIASTPRQGQTSSVETEYVRMVIDHDTGEMTGDVLKGRYAGRTIQDLDVEALRTVLKECAGSDPQGARIVEIYLERAYPGWDDAAESDRERAAGSDSEAGMTRKQALQILGLREGAARQEVIDAHRRLMQKLHPDRGGSGYLAAQINLAKDLLLGPR